MATKGLVFDDHGVADGLDAVGAKMTADVFERRRLNDLSGQSFREETVIVEMVYHNQWVRFDLSGMEAEFLTLAQLATRYLAPALIGVGVKRAPEPELSSSETRVSEES